MPSPHITDYIQLTHDSKFKEVAATDGNRIYVNLLETDAVLQAPITGGELAPIPIQFPGEERPIPGLAPGDFPFVYDLSQDGSTFLCAGPTYSLWSVTTTGNLMRHLGTAQGAAWSPDGRNIVYTWRGDIFLMRSDGSDSRMLVPSKAFPDASQSNSDLSWSPDGSHIRFTRDHELWEVSPSGSDLRSLLPGWRPTSWKSNGRWTLDGEFFIFLTGEPNLIPLPFGNRLWALDERRSWFAPPSLQPIQLTSGPTRWGHPVPSRDGTKIYARGSVLDGELLRFDIRRRMWAIRCPVFSVRWHHIAAKRFRIVCSKETTSVSYLLKSYPQRIVRTVPSVRRLSPIRWTLCECAAIASYSNAGKSRLTNGECAHSQSDPAPGEISRISSSWLPDWSRNPRWFFGLL